MPMNQDVNFPADRTVVEITENSIATMFIQNTGQVSVELMATVDNAPPDFANGAIILEPGQAIVDFELAKFFPGVAGANRLHGRVRGEYGRVFGSHQ